MYCPNCGKELLEGAKFCPDCGEKIEAEKSEAVNTVAEEVEIVEKETVDTFARIEEQSAAPMQEKTEPAQPTPVNTVPPVATNPAPANASFEISSNGKITSGKKGRTKFKNLSPKQKAIRFGIGGLLILIGLIWFISDGIKGSEKAGGDYADNSISDEKTENYNDNIVKNESINSTGGVCFNTTIDEFINNYNNNLAYFYNSNETYQNAGQSYIDSLIDMNSLKISDFEIHDETIEEDTFIDTYSSYLLDYGKVGMGLKRGSAALSINVEPETKEIFYIEYVVSDNLYNANTEHWNGEIPVCIFSDFGVDSNYFTTETSYSNGILSTCFEENGFIHFIISSATKDSYAYKNNIG